MFQSKEDITNYFLANCEDEALDRETMSHFLDFAKYGAKLVVDDAKTPVAIGHSKIGGEPDVPANFSWPTRSAFEDDDASYIFKTGPEPSFLKKKLNALTGNSEPTGSVCLPFLCQLNCAEIHAAGLTEHLPKTGMLYVFYDVIKRPWGYTSDLSEKEAAQIIWLDVEPAQLQRMTSPEMLLRYYQSDQSFDAEKSATGSPLLEQALTVEACLFPALLGDQYFSLYEDKVITEDQGGAYHEVVWEKLNMKFGRGHALLGNPWTLQDETFEHTELIHCYRKSGKGNGISPLDRDKYIANGSGKHLHLLQFDTGEYSGFDFADCAMIYFNIGERDLANRNFEDVVFLVQSY